MQVYKFGGTSLETAHRLGAVRNIIDTGEDKIVVVSANGKSTDHLIQIGEYIRNANWNEQLSATTKLLDYYQKLSGELFQTSGFLNEARQYLQGIFTKIGLMKTDEFDDVNLKSLLAFGEKISSKLLSLYLSESGISNTLLQAEDIITTDEKGNLSEQSIKDRLATWLHQHPEPGIVITQGFICSDPDGNISNLGRGGSDYTATLLGAAANAEKIQIWSDVDGFLCNDPAFIDAPLPLRMLSFDEASELAYFGARILHPSSLLPARQAGIPVLLKNTLNPAAEGTLISSETQTGLIKAVAAKDNITCVTLHSGRMFMAYGFMKKIFSIFDQFETSVDMVTTSEVSVAVTIDDNLLVDQIIVELEKLGDVSVETHQSIICIVGEQLTRDQGRVASVFNALQSIPVKMISYGASHSSITLMVDSREKPGVLRYLQEIISLQPQNTLTYA